MFKMTCVEGEDLTKLCKGIIRPVKCPECDNNGTVYQLVRKTLLFRAWMQALIV